jgi:menaquinone-dependent protoporphyrinogen oxidase
MVGTIKQMKMKYIKFKLIFSLFVIMVNTLNVLASEKKHILIVYGSFSGSTIEIADSMKTYLTNDSTSAETFSAKKEKLDLSKYELILIGSAIHGNAPHPQVLEFIAINREELSGKKVAVFAVCGTITSTKRKKRENARTYPDKVSHGLNVYKKEVFAGNMPSSGKKSDDIMAKLFLGIKTGDYRDWVKIKKWTIETMNKN